MARPTFPSLPQAGVPRGAIVAADVRKTYGKGQTLVHALAGISVEIERGRFTAIMGPSGSGKSTLLHCLAGLDRVSSGSVFLGVTDITTLPDRELTRLRRDHFGFIFQAFNLLPGLTVAENILLPTSLAGETMRPGRLEEVAEAVDLTHLLGRRPAELSGGEQQRVAAARAIFGSPEVLFADEPTGNLDTRAGEELLSLLRSAVDNMGHTVLMVTHDPRAAARADRVIFLSDGQTVGELDSPNTEEVLVALRRLTDPTPASPVQDGELETVPETSRPSEPAEWEDPPKEPLEAPEEDLPLPTIPKSPRPLDASALLQETLDDIAPPPPLSPHAAEVVNQATSILEHLGGSVISPAPEAESTPQTSE